MKSFREDCWLTSLSVKLPAERFLHSIYYCMFEDHWSLWMLTLLSWRILPTVTTKTQVSASGSPCEEPTCCARLLASSLLWNAVIWAQRAQSQGLRYSEIGHLRSQYCFQVKCLHRWEKPHQQFVRAWSCWGACTGQVPWLREELHSSSGVLWAEGEPGWECGFVLFFPAFAFLVCVWKQSFSGQRQFHNIRCWGSCLIILEWKNLQASIFWFLLNWNVFLFLLLEFWENTISARALSRGRAPLHARVSITLLLASQSAQLWCVHTEDHPPPRTLSCSTLCSMWLSVRGCWLCWHLQMGLEDCIGVSHELGWLCPVVWMWPSHPLYLAPCWQAVARAWVEQRKPAWVAWGWLCQIQCQVPEKGSRRMPKSISVRSMSNVQWINKLWIVVGLLWGECYALLNQLVGSYFWFPAAASHDAGKQKMPV